MESKTKRVVVVVFDGLRPDRVTPELTPNLWRFATEGTWFRESRSVFPSVTRVATTSFATGTKPETHGIMNNAFYYPEIVSARLLDTSSSSDLVKADAYHGGRFVQADGLGCALAAVGKTLAVVHTGSAGSAHLVNHKAKANGHWTFSIHGAGHTQTPDAVDEVVGRFGALPESSIPKTAMIDYGADVFVEHVLTHRRPDVALIWFAEPDSSYHYREIGSKQAIAISRRVDEQFGRILDRISSAPDAEETLVIAMSDHGQIATASHVDVFGLLGEAGICAWNSPRADIEAIVTLGIALDISLRQKDDAKLERIAAALMAHPDVGLLFSRTRTPEEGVIAGTLPYAAVGIEHERAADLVCVLRSTDEPDQHGLRGRAACTTPIDVPLGGGMHGGLNPTEQNTVLAFGGAPTPTLGIIDDPADLTDIVPTILDLMGVPRPSGMTGRPLSAVLGQDRPDWSTTTLSAGRRGFQQSLSIAIGGHRPVVKSGARSE